jgi:hypothetical protein
MTEADEVLIPRYVVERALQKARSEYRRVLEEQGRSPGPDECWTEFRQLEGYLRRQDPGGI